MIPALKQAIAIIAVGYIRMSSDKQDKSPAQQRAEIEKLAARMGYRIIRWYVDEGISGDDTGKRVQFLRMMADAERSEFSRILVWDQDRFGRFDSIEAGRWIHPLRESGVSLETVTHGLIDWNDFAGRMIFGIVQEGKHAYLRDLSLNVTRGRLARAKAGRFTGGRAPYGYALDNGKLVLGEAERVETVRWIFETYAETDTSIADIADQLNQRGAPPPSGRNWRRPTVQQIIRRETYLGRALQFRITKSKYHTVVNGEIASVSDVGKGDKPDAGCIGVDCPAIIDQDMWERTQAKLKKHRTHTSPMNVKDRALLSGLLYCGHCGARMHAAQIARRHKGSDKTDLLYVCSTYAHSGNHGCARHPIHQTAVLNYLIGQIRTLMLAPENIDRLRAKLAQKLEARKQTKQTDNHGIQARLAKLDAEIKAAVAELKRTPDDLYDLAVADLRELRTQRDTLAARSEAQQAPRPRQANNATNGVQQALAQMERLRVGLDSADPRILREALQRTVARVDLWFEETRHAKITRSKFKKGVAKLRSCGVVSAHQSAELMSTMKAADWRSARSMSTNCPRWPPW